MEKIYSMPASIVTTEDLAQFKIELVEEIKRLLEKAAFASSKKWLKSHEVRRLLAVSPGTLQALRINGTLPFTKIGGVIFYDYQDILRMMDANKQNVHK